MHYTMQHSIKVHPYSKPTLRTREEYTLRGEGLDSGDFVYVQCANGVDGG